MRTPETARINYLLLSFALHPQYSPFFVLCREKYCAVFFENKLDFSIAHSSSYQLMIDAITKCGPGFVGPSPETLKTTWPESIKSEMSLQSKDSETEWTTTGCTIIADTRTDNKSKSLNQLFGFITLTGLFFTSRWMHLHISITQNAWRIYLILLYKILARKILCRSSWIVVLTIPGL
ncbi:hypothetical protein ACFX13_042809 [Malus domestica]